MATAESQGQGSPRLPFDHRLTSALGWSAICWIGCHAASPALKGVASGSFYEISTWISGEVNRVTVGPRDLGWLVFGIIGGILSIPVLLLFGSIVVILTIASSTVGFLDQFYGSAAVGFYLGSKPGGHAAPFKPLARVLLVGARMVGASYELFTHPRLSDRVWAAAPLFVVLAAAVVAGTTLPELVEQIARQQRPQQSTTIQRFEPGPEWRSLVRDRELETRLLSVELEPARLVCRVQFRAPEGEPARIVVDGGSFIGLRDHALAGEMLALRGDDGRIPVGRECCLGSGETRAATYYFARPRVAADQWMLFLQLYKNRSPVTAPLTFDLGRSPS